MRGNSVSDQKLAETFRDVKAECDLYNLEFTADRIAAKLGIQAQTVKNRVDAWREAMIEKFGAEDAAKRLPEFDRKATKKTEKLGVDAVLDILYRGIEKAANTEE